MRKRGYQNIIGKAILKGADFMKFCERLRWIRLENNMTQKEVYEKLGLSPNGYASYEQGRTEPSIATLIKLCELFDVSADYLLGLKD